MPTSVCTQKNNTPLFQTNHNEPQWVPTNRKIGSTQGQWTKEPLGQSINSGEGGAVVAPFLLLEIRACPSDVSGFDIS